MSDKRPAKEWRLSGWPPTGFADSIGVPAFDGHLLYNRGVRRRSQVGPFIAADDRLRNDPMKLLDMEQAVSRLKQACDSGETIGVFGDFDTDGITGTAVIMQGLRELGAIAVAYLPHRVDEGHGLSEGAVGWFRQKGASLLITVDCGVSSVGEVGLAASWGIDCIITDHHSLPPTLPQACAIVHAGRADSPHYEHEHLTGAGMAFKLVEALWAERGRERPDHLLELVALGTVADVGTLKGENRFFVRRGLEVLNSTQNVGLKALMERARLRPGHLDTDSLSFGLIPRLNAAGRVGHASSSLDLLTADDESEAQRLADELESLNQERRKLADRAIEQARRQVEAGHVASDYLIMVGHKEWLPGIVGLTAGTLAEEYHRPAIAVAIGDEVSRASARSIPNFDIIAALGRFADRFLEHGGHPRAAGFSIQTSELAPLGEDLAALAQEQLAGKDLAPRIDIDCKLSPSVLTQRTLTFLEGLSPFGDGNPEPVFLTRNARVVESRQVGKMGDHLKLRVAQDGGSWDAIAFRQGDRIDEARGRIDLVYAAGLNHWGGQPRLQLRVLDFQPAG